MDRLNGSDVKRGDVIVNVPEITAAWLTKEEACSEQVTRFWNVFGEAVKIDAASYRKAVEYGFDLDWLASKIFYGKTLLRYRKVWRTATNRRDEALSSAWNAMWEIVSRCGTAKDRPDVSLLNYGRAKFAMETYKTIQKEENERFKTTIAGFYRSLGFY